MRKAFFALTALAVIAALAPVHADTRALSRTGTAAVACQGCGGQTKTQAATIPAGWHKYERPGGGYRVALPQEPVTDEFTEEIDGVEYPTHAAMAALADDGVIFVAADRQYLAAADLSQAEKILNLAQEQFTEGGTVTKQRDVQIQGRPGRELLVDAQGLGVVHMRLVFTGDRVIVLAVILMDGAESPDVARFFDSFEWVQKK